MPEHIDREAFKRKLIEKGFFPAIVQRALEEMPREDVVPKSEVAREIFEEIEEIACVYKLDGDFYLDNGLYSQLKKKYTEGSCEE